jgi:hypothetical protein
MATYVFSDLKKIFAKELELIKDQRIKDLTCDILDAIPHDIWRKPASYSHHNKLDRGTWGMVNHTQALVDVALSFARAKTIEGIELDILVSVGVVHDICKYGPGGKSPIIEVDHPQMAYDLIMGLKNECPYKQRIAQIVNDHMGKWSTGKTFNNDRLNKLIQFADIVASKKNVDVYI